MKKVKTLIHKELLDILRDKKTLIMMVVVPVLLYPLIIIGMSLIMVNIMTSQETEVHRIGYSAEYVEVADRLAEIYEEQQEEDRLGKGVLEEKDNETETAGGEESALDEEMAAETLEFIPAETGLEAEVKENTDAWVEFSTEADGTLRAEIQYTSTDQSSLYAKETLEELLDEYRETLLITNLEAEGLGENFLYPVVYEAQDSSTLSESMGMDIGGSIGMMLIVTILLGAIYPAIDATAGEKERGTLETLLTLPVTNFQMILSKYVSVALIASVTAILSLLSLGGSVLFLMFGLSSEIAEEMQGISMTGILTAVPVLLLTLVVTALLASALCMCFCIFAKSFKEANNYITPVLLVVMFASMAGMVPSITLNYKTAMIPIVNVSLMVKSLISGQLDLALAGITICTNLGCSILIIWILAKMYDSENILFADGFRSFRIFQKRSEIEKGTIPDVGDLVISITLLFLLLLYVGSAASLRLGFWGTAVSQLLILAIPLLVTWYMKTDVKKLFALKRPAAKTLLPSLVLYVGTWCLVMGLSSLLVILLPESTQNVADAFSAMAEQPLWSLLLVTAVMPGIGEEILFRGFLFGSLREKLGKSRGKELACEMEVRNGTAGYTGPGKQEGLQKKAGTGKQSLSAIVISALIFGLFHMSLVKLLPTALLGASFAYVVHKTGSIYVTMFLHFLNNTISMLALKYPEKVMELAPFLAKETLSWTETGMLLGTGMVIVGLGLMWLRIVEGKE